MSGSTAALIDAHYLSQDVTFGSPVDFLGHSVDSWYDILAGPYPIFDEKHPVVVLPSGILAVPGYGDDGAYKHYLGRNAIGDLVSIRCEYEKLEYLQSLSPRKGWLERIREYLE